MTYDEAISEAILGARVRHKDMIEGSYIYYNFGGVRIEFVEGSNSPWSANELALSADWYFLESPPIGEVIKPIVKKIVGGWGNKPPITIYDETAKIDPKVWAPKKTLDPKKGGW